MDKVLVKAKREIRDRMSKRTTTTRAKKILREAGIDVHYRVLWEWLNYDNRRSEHESQYAAAYLRAIEEERKEAAQLEKKVKRVAMMAA